MKLIEIQEGLGTFLVPKSNIDEHIPRRSDEVFFNFHQEINRDLSVLALRAYGDINSKSEMRICEPLCGSGIRSARYALEAPASKIYCNDINSKAVEISQKNIKRLPNTFAEKIRLYNMDCNSFLQFLNVKDIVFDFIDIDPFGTPIPFVHNSIHLINLHGLLACTATDLASLVGLYPQALFAKYGVSQFNARIGNIHELASRALITGVQHVGLTLGQSLIPILTFYHRHFVRCFFIRNRGVDNVMNKTGFIHLCKECKTRFITKLGEKTNSCCGSSNRIMTVGPLFIGKIQHPDYLRSMLLDEHLKKMGTKKKLRKSLSLMIEESLLDIPWSFDIPVLAKKCHTPVPPLTQVIKLLKEMGYHCSRTHYSGTCLKTNAMEPEMNSIITALKSKINHT
jgi:tRNA (guanine26-N2/guanine27-N2)-dimethyltransferase